MIKSEFLQKCHDLRWTQSELEEDLDAVIQAAIEDHERSKKTIKAKALRKKGTDEWYKWKFEYWREVEKPTPIEPYQEYYSLPPGSELIDITIIVNEP